MATYITLKVFPDKTAEQHVQYYQTARAQYFDNQSRHDSNSQKQEFLPYQIAETVDEDTRESITNLIRSRKMRLRRLPTGIWLIEVQRGDWKAVDKHIDSYVGRARLGARKLYNEESCLQWWNNDLNSRHGPMHLIKHAITNVQTQSVKTDSPLQSTIGQLDLFNAMWNLPKEMNVPRECTLFRATRAKDVIQFLLFGPDAVKVNAVQFANKRWLDISAGWGDRLLAACCLDMLYVGYDPNPKLQSGHQAIIKDFSETGPFKQTVVPHPFETDSKDRPMTVKEQYKSYCSNPVFDVIFTSPPYFNLELYNDDDMNQSTYNYTRPQQWLGQFLCFSIYLAWAGLKVGGKLAINIDSTPTVPAALIMASFMQHELRDSERQVDFGFGGKGFDRPQGIVYSWTKCASMRPVSMHTLYTFQFHYPKVYSEYQKALLKLQ